MNPPERKPQDKFYNERWTALQLFRNAVSIDPDINLSSGAWKDFITISTDTPEHHIDLEDWINEPVMLCREVNGVMIRLGKQDTNGEHVLSATAPDGSTSKMIWKDV